MNMGGKIAVGAGVLAAAIVALATWARHSNHERIAQHCYGALYNSGDYQGVGVGPATVREVIEYDRSAYHVEWKWVSVRNAKGELEPRRKAECLTWGAPGDLSRWEATVWFEGEGKALPEIWRPTR